MGIHFLSILSILSYVEKLIKYKQLLDTGYQMSYTVCDKATATTMLQTTLTVWETENGPSFLFDSLYIQKITHICIVKNYLTHRSA